MKRTIITGIILMAISAQAMAHSIRIEVKQDYPAITINAGFSKTSPIANALVEILSPELDSPYQTGRTDINGHFAFLPNKAGSWKVTINDEMGHVRRTDIVITEDFFEVDEVEKTIEVEIEKDVEEVKAAHQVSETEIPVIYKAIFGLSIIFGITGIFYVIKAKNNKK